MLARLPRHQNSKICNIHFCSCSDTVSAIDMAEAIVQELKNLENVIEAHVALTGDKVIVFSQL